PDLTPARPARPFGPLPVQALERLETGCHLALATIRQTQDNGIGKHDISHDFLLMFWWSFSEQGIRLRLLSQLTSGKRRRRLQADQDSSSSGSRRSINRPTRVPGSGRPSPISASSL